MIRFQGLLREPTGARKADTPARIDYCGYVFLALWHLWLRSSMHCSLKTSFRMLVMVTTQSDERSHIKL